MNIFWYNVIISEIVNFDKNYSVHFTLQKNELFHYNNTTFSVTNEIRESSSKFNALMFLIFRNTKYFINVQNHTFHTRNE